MKCSHGKTEPTQCWLCKLENAATQTLNEVLEEGEQTK